jgi:hypothetical protein
MRLRFFSKKLIRRPSGALKFLSIVVARRAVVHLFHDAAMMRSSLANRRETEPAVFGDRDRTGSDPHAAGACAHGVKHLRVSEAGEADRGDAGQPAPFSAGNSAPD